MAKLSITTKLEIINREEVAYQEYPGLTASRTLSRHCYFDDKVKKCGAKDANGGNDALTDMDKTGLK